MIKKIVLILFGYGVLIGSTIQSAVIRNVVDWKNERIDYRPLTRDRIAQVRGLIADNKKYVSIQRNQRGIQRKIIKTLNSSLTNRGVARQLDKIVTGVFSEAQRQHYAVHPQAERHLKSALKALPESSTAQEFTFYLATVEHLVNDIQHVTDQKASLLERSPAFLAQAVSSYYGYLVPTTNELSLIVDAARYICDITVGTHYLSPEMRQRRIDQFWHMLDSLSFKNLSKMTVEQWIDTTCYVAARATYVLSASAAFAVLKNIKNVGSAFSGAAGLFAQRFIHIFDQVIGAHPAVITGEGAVVWNASPAVIAEVRQTIQAFEGMKDIQSDKKIPDILDSAQKVMEKENKLKVKTVNDLINESKPGEKTAGPTTQYERYGGYSKALEDFEALKPKDVRDISNEMGIKKVGTLEDGSKVVVRDHSKGLETKGPPTLEIQIAGKYTKIKFRYR